MNAVDVIDGAIEAVSGNWCQGSLYTKDGQLCLRGALYVGAGAELKSVELGNGGIFLDLNFNEYDKIAYVEASQAVCSVLARDYPDSMSIPSWNDDIASSEEDVILALKHARELVSE